jgi:peptidoglycan hydrolase-like protein with peptidoglycan-binding domain
MTDTIRAALEAAGAAVVRVQGYADETTHDAAAAAIAAFLRALPDHAAGRYGYELAAAVEAAAKEAGDG